MAQNEPLRVKPKLGPHEQELVTSVMPLIDLLARRARRRFQEVPFADLVSIGREAAVEAALQFEPNRGVPFEGFAFKHIQGSMIRKGTTEAAGHLHMAIRRAFLADESPPPADLDLDEALADTPEAARARAVLWIRKQAAGMFVGALFEAARTANGGEHEHVERDERERAHAALKRAVEALDPDEKHFVERLYRDGAGMDEIAKELGVVRRTVTRLHDKIKDKLAKRLRWSGVESLPPVGAE